MIQKYNNLDELWSHWGTATSAIMKYIENEETLNWNFIQACVSKQHDNGYSVSIIHTGFDSTSADQILLSVQANVTANGEVTVSTIKRETIESQY